MNNSKTYFEGRFYWYPQISRESLLKDTVHEVSKLFRLLANYQVMFEDQVQASLGPGTALHTLINEDFPEMQVASTVSSFITPDTFIDRGTKSSLGENRRRWKVPELDTRERSREELRSR